jgi:2-oxoglutarate ferredoxin oxidoreductase subunit delta
VTVITSASARRSSRIELTFRYSKSLRTATEILRNGEVEKSESFPERAAMAQGSVQIVTERCKACGFCVEFCPTHVLALSSAFNAKGYHTPFMVHPDKCSGCDLCGMYCPDFAIFGFKVPQGEGCKTPENDAKKAQLTNNGAPEANAAETSAGSDVAAMEVQDAR